MIEPTGAIENDPNLTDKKFTDNPTKPYRTPSSVRAIGEVASWERHLPEQVKAMKGYLEQLKQKELRQLKTGING